MKTTIGVLLACIPFGFLCYVLYMFAEEHGIKAVLFVVLGTAVILGSLCGSVYLLNGGKV